MLGDRELRQVVRQLLFQLLCISLDPAGLALVAHALAGVLGLWLGLEVLLLFLNGLFHFLMTF